ncbi:MAG: glycosyltransferase [Acidimicrobiaceae bacterium]|nr:glycosyltransferase [Acidimicrobiaceae bacterium]
MAETYTLIDACLFGTTMWRSRARGPAPSAPAGLTVDVFITTYNEPVDLVMTTAKAAKAIPYPHTTWILDDGARDELRSAAEMAAIGYMTRDPEWMDRPRHAKAGNLNNALMHTSGEFILILDADQIPDPAILDKALGWFTDPKVALVQTPQWFWNVEPNDPLGSQAPMFYGPIQQGKDGWNAAFFCGSNAILRREALMELGVVGYVRETTTTVRAALDTSDHALNHAARQHSSDPQVARALVELRRAAADARRELDKGDTVAEVTHRFSERVHAASVGIVRRDLDAIDADLSELGLTRRPDVASFGERIIETDRELGLPVVDETRLHQLATLELSPLAAIDSVRSLAHAVDVIRYGEAQPVMPMEIFSVTEDMATAMHLHALGWRSVYHHEILARGLAPEDLPSMLHQRLRWGQGTLQVLLKDNPLVLPGLSIGQRLMYFATMWSYLSGFFALAFLVAPMLYLLFGVIPVHSYDAVFLGHLIPYLVATQALFFAVGYGRKPWRGQQYSLALFPIWIRATITAAANVWFGRSLGFMVTPKTRQSGAPVWGVVRWQLIAIGLLILSVVVGVIRLLLGIHPSTIEGTAINLVWVGYDLLVLSVIIQAGLYTGFQPPAERDLQEGAP